MAHHGQDNGRLHAWNRLVSASPRRLSAAFRQAGPKHPAILPHDGPSVDPRYRPIRFAGFSPGTTLP